MKLRIKLRDIIFFILGILALTIAEVAFDFDAHKKAFQDGRDKAMHKIEKSKSIEAVKEKVEEAID